MQAVWISIGAVAGANARYWVGLLFARILPWNFPYGTLFINLSGSFVLGLFFAIVNVRYPSSSIGRLLIATGFCGAYTTFSSFTYEALELIREGSWGLGALYVSGSVLAGLGAVGAGYALGGLLART